MCWETEEQKSAREAAEAKLQAKRIDAKLAEAKEAKEYNLTTKVKNLVDGFHSTFPEVAKQYDIDDRLARMLIHLRSTNYWNQSDDDDYIAYAKFKTLQKRAEEAIGC